MSHYNDMSELLNLIDYDGIVDLVTNCNSEEEVLAKMKKIIGPENNN